METSPSNIFSAIGACGNSPIARLPLDSDEAARRMERQRRFTAFETSTGSPSLKDATLVQVRESHGVATARGENTNLEKEYLRLTSLPIVADVRPPHVLLQALKLIQQKWKDGVSYKYACDQLKSIRQDLTVQHMRNALTVAVYETHSRIALEVGDWAQLRQVLSVLKTLYRELELPRPALMRRGSSGGKKIKRKREEDGMARAVAELDAEATDSDATQNEAEFFSYLLMLAAATGKDVLAHELQVAVERDILSSTFVGHALAACRAYTSGAYIRLLQLYPEAPRMQPYLLDLLLERLRPKVWATVLAAFGGPCGIPLTDVGAWLGFGNGWEAEEWVKTRGGVVGDDAIIDLKASRAGLMRMERGATGAASAVL